MGMTLPYVAALTPQDFQIELVDDRCQEVDFSGDYNLVGITVTSDTANRAYQISARFRHRGIPVVMGGFHASLCPEEALEHADAIVVGEAEYVWEPLLRDLQAGRLKGVYQASRLHDLKALPHPRYDLLDKSFYRFLFYPVQTSRGCPFHCKFCEVPQVYGGVYRFRPLEEVVEEVKAVKNRRLQFVDDNLTADREYAKALFEALIPLNVKWSGLWTINTPRDEELLELAARSGCFHVNIGIESVSQNGLNAIDKRQNQVRDFKRMLGALREKGIFFSLNFLFGLDGESKDIFDSTLGFLEEVKAPMAFFNIVTPRKGTRLREELEKEGRMIKSELEWHLGPTCMFLPENMSPQEVETGLWRTYQSFYSLRSIAKRLLLPPNRYLAQALPSNLIFLWAVKRRIDPVDFY